ncbi:sec-independent protein translocase protein TatC [Friedmanniella endophytica]|uniref:Sec-independent protein translocase protein TatC n=1 Tax=Microlunatus kandeliicorticis TaxID=1759536 RepID=A0A7W3IU06_9ACTN|nr:twin-arginine translocase subunit TatC [Microlunatus kandeliicorticis]MBA8795247.1 sec-independent protein translocase protein TatC [Microlunatus kandeliicorticis]
MALSLPRLRLRRPSFAWLKPPPLPPDGNMTLFEHLRELRYRLVVASIAIIVGMIVCLIFADQLFNLLLEPYKRAVELAQESRPDIKAEPIFSGLTSPFLTSFKIALLAGLVVSAPVWLYQVWAFIVPGLLAKEKRWTGIVVGCATPLFLGGIALGYYVTPNGMAALLKFTPANVGATNLQSINDFLSFLTRLMFVFGVAFEIPLFILLLNLAGVLSAKMISKYRSYLIFGVFVFAAIATPSPDAITMLMLALPLAVLVVVAEVLAHIFDRRKRKRNGGIDADSGIAHDKALAALEAEDAARAQATASEPARVASQVTISANGISDVSTADTPAPRTMAQALGLDRQN